MNENIKIVVIPNDQERKDTIDFIFKAVQKEKELWFPIESVKLGESFEKIETFLYHFDELEAYKKREIYHFDCFRNYMKVYHFEFYKRLDLDNPILDYMQDSYITLLLKVFQKLTEAGFISILNSNYVTIVYAPQNGINLFQQRNLDRLKQLMVENKMIELVKCSGHETETLRGNKEVIDTYLDSMYYKREEIKTDEFKYCRSN